MLPRYSASTMRRLARNVIRNSLRMKRGENLLIQTWTATLSWASSFVLEARILGVRPMLVVEDEDAFWRSAAEAAAPNVGQVGRHDWAALKASDAVVYLHGPIDNTLRTSLPEGVLGRMDATDHEWFRLVSKHGIRSVRWDLGRTNEIWARRYDVNLDKWRNEMVEGAVVDPRTLQRKGVRVASRLRRGRSLRISHSNGTELSLRLAGRQPRVEDGIMDEADIKAGNVCSVIPSGVVTVAVDETYAEGTFVANIMGVLFLRGVDSPLKVGSWTFRGGRLTHYTIESGGDVFRRAFAKLGPGKDLPGLLSVGLNPETSTLPFIFDQERGVITLAIGSNSHLGGATRTPRFRAFAAIRGATLEVDGKAVVKEGRLA